MSAICTAGHRRRVEEVNEAVLPPRVQPLPHTSLDVLFNTAREALWQVPRLWGCLPCCRGPYYIQRADSLAGLLEEQPERWSFVEDCGPMRTDCTVSRMSAHSYATWAPKLNIAKPPQHAPRLKVYKESHQPKVYHTRPESNKTSVALEIIARLHSTSAGAKESQGEETNGPSRPRTQHGRSPHAQTEKFYRARAHISLGFYDFSDKSASQRPAIKRGRASLTLRGENG